MEHIVTGCKNCCFYNAYYGGENISGSADTGATCCQHPKAPTKANGEMYQIIEGKNFNTITPKWCPLNKEPITIVKQ